MKNYIWILFLFIICNTCWSKDLVIVSAEWCSPCQQLKQFIQNNKQEIYFDIEYIDFDQDKETALKLKVNKVPSSFIFDDNGKLLSKRIGFDKSYSSWLKENE